MNQVRPLNAMSLTEAMAALRRGDCTSTALTEACLAAIARDNGRLNAFVFLDAAGARRAAQAADDRRRRSASLGELDGVPVAIKANIAVAGWPHSAGLRFRRETFADEDAHAVARLRDAGAVLLGSTNMDEGALGATGANPWFGNTQHPARHGYSPGGSSSGSAAAVAAGLCSWALGTDTIGSIRIPAAFCGVTGLKPSTGLVSVRGVVPVHPRFDHVGPLVRAAADLAPALRALAGYDPRCPVSFPWTLQPPKPAGATRQVGFGVGLEREAIAPEVVNVYNLGIAALRRLGVQLTPVDLRRWDLPRVRRAILALCEHEMWRSHGERMTEAPLDYSDPLRAFIRFGGRLGAEDLVRAETRIANFRNDWLALTAPLEAVILPSAACTAYPFAERHPDNTAELTAIATAAGVPALSVPLPVDAGELPVGLQLVGRPGGDLDLIQLAADYAGTAAA
jgi:aspartyl-tRNA(Asn)/glutamyl-tRNA(Gln) amidotransferase subunit A